MHSRRLLCVVRGNKPRLISIQKKLQSLVPLTNSQRTGPATSPGNHLKEVFVLSREMEWNGMKTSGPQRFKTKQYLFNNTFLKEPFFYKYECRVSDANI